MKKKRFSSLGKAPHWWRDQLGWGRGRWGALVESAATGLWRAKWKDPHSGWYGCLALPRLRCSFDGTGGGWMLRLSVITKITQSKQ